MPFNQPQKLSFTVTLNDINSGESTAGNFNNPYINSLAKCLYRLNNSFLLPGQENDTFTYPNCMFYASSEVRFDNGKLLSICDVYVCDKVYTADENTTLKIALENIAGIKPSEEYIVNLVSK